MQAPSRTYFIVKDDGIPADLQTNSDEVVAWAHGLRCPPSRAERLRKKCTEETPPAARRNRVS